MKERERNQIEKCHFIVICSVLVLLHRYASLGPTLCRSRSVGNSNYQTGNLLFTVYYLLHTLCINKARVYSSKAWYLDPLKT